MQFSGNHTAAMLYSQCYARCCLATMAWFVGMADTESASGANAVEKTDAENSSRAGSVKKADSETASRRTANTDNPSGANADQANDANSQKLKVPNSTKLLLILTT